MVFVWLAWAGASGAVADEPSTETTIAGLIEQLDAPQYEIRQAAVKELAAMRTQALRPLALHALDGSPESAWRIKHILELIGTQGDESDFYKAVGILQMLHLDDASSLTSRFKELHLQWKIRQKGEIVEHLKKLGAEVETTEESRVVMGGNLQRQIVLNNMFIEIQGGPQVISGSSSNASTDSQSASDRHPQPRLTKKQTLEQMDKILTASLDENRESIFKNTGVTADNSPEDAQSLRARQLNLAYGQANSNAGSVQIRLTDTWKGDAKDLDKLNNLMGLSQIELHNFHPGEKELASLASLKQLPALKITGSQISTDELGAFSKLPNLRQIELGQQSVDKPLGQTLALFPQLSLLTLTECKIEPKGLLPLSQAENLRAIYMQDMQIRPEVFEQMETLTGVRFLNLSICKFDTAAYKRLLESRGNLQIVFTPQALLGVRGQNMFQAQQFRELPIGGQNQIKEEIVAGCRIDQVVPGSGAEKGGIRAGDVVQEIDGQPVKQFDDLRLHIAQHRAGDKINVSVLRDGKPVKLQVELTKFDRNLE